MGEKRKRVEREWGGIANGAGRRAMMAAATVTATKQGWRRRRWRDLNPRRLPTSPPRSSGEEAAAAGDTDKHRRTLRPRRRRPLILDDFADFDDYLHDDEDEEEDDEELRRKHRKLKLVLKLHPPLSPVPKRSEAAPTPAEQRRRSRSALVSESRNRRVAPADATSSEETSSSSYVEDHEDEEAIKPPPKRRLGGWDVNRRASDGSAEVENGPKNTRKDSVSGVSRNSLSGTPLPEKKVLEAILDKLQKKDKYRVFAEPVDPEELPDYYDVIEHPMDYGTLRKKLDRNSYHCLEHFEDDVFLICSNAMQYNAPDTVYFRQARCMHEIGKKEFQRLKTEYKHDESDCRTEENIRVDSVEHKTIENTLSRTVQEPLGSDISSAETWASAGDACTLLTKPPITEPTTTASCPADGSSSLGESKPEKVDELSAKDSPSNLGKKPLAVDEHLRDTYTICNQQPVVEESDLISDIFDCEQKQLIVVGLDVEYSYARSLAHFAASLGPIGWKIASEKIANALPAGVKFGPGWVGGYEPLPCPVLCLKNHHQQQLNAHSALQSKMSLTKQNKFEVVNKSSGIGNVMLSSSRIQNPIDRKTSSIDSHLVKGNVDRRTRELTQHLFNDTSETQPRLPATLSQQKRETINPNLANCRSKTLEQIEVPWSSVVNSSGDNSVLQRSDVCPQAVTCRTPGVIPFQTPLQPRFSGKVEPQAEASRSCVTNDAQIMHADESVNRRFFVSSGRDFPSNPGFISKHQPEVLGNWQSPGSNELRVIGYSRQTDSSKFTRQASSTNRSSDIPQLDQSSVAPVNRDGQKIAASTAARAWMSIGASSQSGKSVSSAGVCSIQTESTSASFNSSWRTPNSSPRNIDESKSKLKPFSPGFMQPSQVVVLESQIQNQGLVIYPQLVPNDLARFGSPTTWQGPSPQAQKHNKVCPPDLNISFQQPGSPVLQSSGILKDSQQPDLALQL